MTKEHLLRKAALDGGVYFSSPFLGEVVLCVLLYGSYLRKVV